MKHIILDLDETIVSITEKPSASDHFQFTIGSTTYYGQKRPGLKPFLEYIFKTFDSVNVWTAATRAYADHVLHFILTPRQRAQLKFLYTRDNVQVEKKTGMYSKPLRKIFSTPEAKALGITRKNTLMVDDREDIFKNNKGNGMVIPPWHRHAHDKYLNHLTRVLKLLESIELKSAKRPFILLNFLDK
jgi:TFIIF-interacting CTD phosphatase-like protein